MKTIEERMLDKDFVASLPTNRLEALAVGAKLYISKPCKRGHNSYRKAENGQCCKCSSIANKERSKLTDLEKHKKMRERIDKQWNNSISGKNAKQRWKERNPKWAWVISAVGGAKTRAREKGIPFALTKEHVYSILTDICPILGYEFIFIGNKQMSERSPSIDRINPKLGYVDGNVAIISVKANAIKSNASWEEIEKVAKWLKDLAI